MAFGVEVHLGRLFGAKSAAFILVPQFIALQSFNNLSDYWTLEAEIAAQFENIHLIDVRQVLRNKNEKTLLEDNNHFSRKGHQEFAYLLEPSALFTDQIKAVNTNLLWLKHSIISSSGILY